MGRSIRHEDIAASLFIDAYRKAQLEKQVPCPIHPIEKLEFEKKGDDNYTLVFQPFAIRDKRTGKDLALLEPARPRGEGVTHVVVMSRGEADIDLIDHWGQTLAAPEPEPAIEEVPSMEVPSSFPDDYDPAHHDPGDSA